jgi:hypothetical protein
VAGGGVGCSKQRRGGADRRKGITLTSGPGRSVAVGEGREKWAGAGLVGCRDGYGSGSDRVDCLGTQNRNPNLKPETDPNTDSGEKSCPKLNPRISETRLDTRNPLRMATYEEQSRLL